MDVSVGFQGVHCEHGQSIAEDDAVVLVVFLRLSHDVVLNSLSLIVQLFFLQGLRLLVFCN